MLSDREKSYLRYLSVLYGDNPESGKASFYPAYMRMRMNEIRTAAHRDARAVFMGKWMIPVFIVILLACLAPVGAIFTLMSPTGADGDLKAFAMILGGAGVLMAIAIWLSMGPLFAWAGARTDTELAAKPLDEADGDAAIIARSNIVTLAACGIALAITAVTAVMIYQA